MVRRHAPSRRLLLSKRSEIVRDAAGRRGSGHCRNMQQAGRHAASENGAKQLVADSATGWRYIPTSKVIVTVPLTLLPQAAEVWVKTGVASTPEYRLWA